MVQVDFVEFHKTVDKVDGKMKVDVKGTEMYSLEEFDEMLAQKKKLIQERQQQIYYLRRKLVFAEAVKESEELTKFRELLKQANALDAKEDDKRNLKILELDYANIEREVLEYDNWLKAHGKKHAAE